MSTKTIVVSLIGVILIGGAIYFTMSQKSSKVTTLTTPIQTTQKENSTSTETQSTPEPTKNSSSNEIIDYIVDGQSSDEIKAAEASIDTSSSATVEPTISTNF